MQEEQGGVTKSGVNAKIQERESCETRGFFFLFGFQCFFWGFLPFLSFFASKARLEGLKGGFLVAQAVSMETALFHCVLLFPFSFLVTEDKGKEKGGRRTKERKQVSFFHFSSTFGNRSGELALGSIVGTGSGRTFG